MLNNFHFDLSTVPKQLESVKLEGAYTGVSWYTVILGCSAREFSKLCDGQVGGYSQGFASTFKRTNERSKSSWLENRSCAALVKGKGQ